MTHDARHRIAERRPTTMTHMHGTSGIRGNILEVHLARNSKLGLAVFFSKVAHRAHHFLKRRRFEREVDETRTSDIHALDEGIFRKMIDDDLCDLARVLVSNFRKTHCDRASPVSMRFFTWTLKAWLGHCFKRKAPIVHARSKRTAHDLFQRFTNRHADLPSLFPIDSPAGPLPSSGDELMLNRAF